MRAVPTVLGIAVVAAAGYGLLLGALFVFQRNLIYVPSRERPTSAAYGVPDMAEVTLRTADGLDLNAWYRAAAPGRPTLVYYHGNAGHIGHRGGRGRALVDAGLGVLLVEYRGYGGNPGRPTQAGLLADGRAALTFLAEQGVAPSDVVLLGESLGSSVAVHMAAEQAEAGTPVRALILEAPFTSAADVGARQYPWAPVRRMIKDPWNSLAVIGRIGAPLFLYHGDADAVVPQRQGRTLFAAAPEPKHAWWVDGGGHTDLDDFGAMERVAAYANGLQREGVTGTP